MRLRLRIEGTVQGVGFRPFAAHLAAELGLTGFVRNDARGAWIEVEGDAARVDSFAARLARESPPLAALERVERTELAPRGDAAFVIETSRAAGPRSALVAPDVAACDACLREIADPDDRRFRYAFTNCTDCGPRFSIVRDVPYDRAATTMSAFPPCAACAAEYADPLDRRFHAEPVCCPACGPALALVASDGKPEPGDPLRRAAALLRAGAILAVKGLGGYHLAALARDEAAVAALRARKKREARPFAVLVPSLAEARALAFLDDAEERALQDARRPIVLARRRPEAALPSAVAPGSRRVGLLLPYTPLHVLLAGEVGAPFVLTSANLSDEPIVYRDDDARERLAAIADFLLVHDRPIHVPCDDSVVLFEGGAELPIRRSRGMAPRPLPLPIPARRPILACGAQMKGSFCLAKDDRAFLSQHFGDLDDWPTFLAWRDGIGHFERLFDVAPALVAHDLHPEYRSTRFALELHGVEHVAVQHHHAHAAACLAEHGVAERVLAVCFDGLGYGDDGTLWGGELLLADLAVSARIGGLRALPLPGGSAAIRSPWRMAAVYLDAAFDGRVPDSLAVVRRNTDEWDRVIALARSGVHSPLASSAGRLFDAAAALAAGRDHASYEGQGAIELEQLADPAADDAYPMRATGGVLVGADLIRAAADDLTAGTPPERVATRFHGGLAAAIVSACGELCAAHGVARVALTGGVFQNALLAGLCARGLARAGLAVLRHERVPPNDAGIAYGQAVVAAARDRDTRM